MLCNLSQSNTSGACPARTVNAKASIQSGLLFRIACAQLFKPSLLRTDDVLLGTLLILMESGTHRKKGPVQLAYYHFFSFWS